MNKITTVAIDLGKEVFQVGFGDRHGREVGEQKRIKSREEFARFIETLQPSLCAVMEVGLGAQAWAAKLQARGIRVRLLPAQLVVKHRCGGKNDRNDVRAILRAAQDDDIHDVAVKSPEQLAMQALHRARAGWTSRRTAVSNQMRGLLTEHGVVFAKGDAAFERGIAGALADASVPLPWSLRDLLGQLLEEWHSISARIEAQDHELKRLARTDPIARRLDAIPGVGPITATAMACKAIELKRFENCRKFAATFGLIPAQDSSSDKVRLGRMTRQGDPYLRSVLVSGAQSVVKYAVTRTDQQPMTRRLQRWAQRHGAKGAAVRLANHNLRVIFQMLTRNEDYRR